jgi:hypothetical protein
MSLREANIRERMASVTEQYAGHIITEQSTHGDGMLGRWTLHRRYPDGKWSSDMWCEIIEGRGGYLYVNGDISACVFGICGGVKGPGAMVAWMARPSPGDSYMAEKLRIGMGPGEHDFDPARSWDADVAIEDIEAWRAEHKADADDSEDEDENNSLDEILDDLRNGDSDQHSMCRALYDAGVDPEQFSCWGLVPSSRIVCAWAALRRLHALLTADTGARS